jgi:hypothetical protein
MQQGPGKYLHVLFQLTKLYWIQKHDKIIQFFGIHELRSPNMFRQFQHKQCSFMSEYQRRWILNYLCFILELKAHENEYGSLKTRGDNQTIAPKQYTSVLYPCYTLLKRNPEPSRHFHATDVGWNVSFSLTWSICILWGPRPATSSSHSHRCLILCLSAPALISYCLK